MADLEKITKKPLGQLLVEEGVVTAEQVREALALQNATGELLGHVLVRAAYTTEEAIVRILCQQFGKPFIRVTHYDIPIDALKSIPPRLMVDHCFIPLDKFPGLLVLALGGVLDNATLTHVQRHAGCELEIYISSPTEVAEVLRKQFPDLYDPVTGNPVPAKPGELEAATAPPADDTMMLAGAGTDDDDDDDDEMGEVTREFQGVAGEESDWERLFEEAEQNVLDELRHKPP